MKRCWHILCIVIICSAVNLPLEILADQVRLVSERDGELTVEVLFDESAYRTDPPVKPYFSSPGLPRLHYLRFFVAIPEGAACSARVTAQQRYDLPVPLPERIAGGRTDAEGISVPKAATVPRDPVMLSDPHTFRNTSVVAVDCFPLQADYENGTTRAWSSYRVTISYPPLGRDNRVTPTDPFLSRLVMNERFFPAPARPAATVGATGAVPDPHFSLASNWVRIEITARGIFAITGNDLLSLGYSINQINPATFRLFTAGGINQNRAYSDDSGTWKAGNWMRECAIQLRDGHDGSFGPQDTLVFYGLGPQGWHDFYEPEIADTLYFDHLYSTSNVYYLTWGGSFGEAVARMDTVSAAPSAGPFLTSYRERLHLERDRVKNFNFGGDGWLWIEENPSRAELPPGDRLFPTFPIDNLVPSVPQTFRTIALAPYCGDDCKKYVQEHPWVKPNENHHAVYKMNGTTMTEQFWNCGYASRYENGVPVTATGFYLQEGINRHSVEIPRDLNPIDFMYFDFYSIFYERRLRATAGALAFSLEDTTALVTMQVKALPATGNANIFDVTDQYNPVFMNRFTLVPGANDSRNARFSSQLLGEKKHYWLCMESTIKSPASMSRRTPRDLRNAASAPNMLILYHEAFQSAAERLRNHRLNNLPHYDNPAVAAVTIDDVYDNFSGGVHDPMAIRNYCKFLYDNFSGGGQVPLGYLVLLGDANTDYKNIATSQPDYLATYLQLNPFEGEQEAYASDDFYVMMDSSDQIYGNSMPDIAVGRLPAASPSEAEALVGKIIAYETSNDIGTWRSRVILAADDEISTRSKVDDIFTVQSEWLNNYYLPAYIDVFKIYLTEFPDRGGGNKPDARNLFISEWRKGALIVNYIGHGSSRQMADERVFLESDVNVLDNENRLPLMCAFSCTIGDYDNASVKSLSEKLLLKDDGGVIGCIAASQVTYIYPNFNLDQNLFQYLFPDDPGLAEPLGSALMLAKAEALPNPNQFQAENNDKYNLMSDPALRLVIPQRWLSFESSDTDTILAGHLKRIRGQVTNESGVDTTFSGTVHLFVRESDDTTGYTRPEDGFFIYYRYPGGVMYRGVSDVTAGRFSFDFHVPSYPNPGRYGYVMGYAYDTRRGEDAARVKKDIKLVYPPPGTPLPEPLDGAPRVDLGFEGGINKIKPGAVLRADVRDADGINILSTTNEGRQVLVLDQTTIPIDVSDYFTFYEGGADTSGYLRFAMNDISAGNHRVIYKVGDSFGQLTLDTLLFTVVDPMDDFADAVFNYPNPFTTSTHFLFHLSGRASIRLDIYTTSGKRVRSLDAVRDGGEAWIYWDGRDSAMDMVANGVYLYIARVEFLGTDTPPQTVRGKVVKVE